MLEGNLSTSMIHASALRIISEVNRQQARIAHRDGISAPPHDCQEAGPSRLSLQDLCPTSSQQGAGAKEEEEEDFLVIKSFAAR
jgi:hypothetical protein